MKFEETGGPAYPIKFPLEPKPGVWQAVGLTVLDYFAAAALQGLLAQHKDVEDELGDVFRQATYQAEGGTARERLAHHAYQIAIAMRDVRDAMKLELLDGDK